MVLPQKQIRKSIKQNREARKKTTHPQSTNLNKGPKNIQWGEDSL